VSKTSLERSRGSGLDEDGVGDNDKTECMHWKQSNPKLKPVQLFPLLTITWLRARGSEICRSTAFLFNHTSLLFLAVQYLTLKPFSQPQVIYQSIRMVMVHHTPPAEALAAHLINQTVHSVSILESLNLISPADARTIRAKLLSSAGPFPSLALPTQPESDISSSFGSLNVAGGSSSLFGAQSSVPSLPPRGRLSGSETKARALWDYHGTVCH